MYKGGAIAPSIKISALAIKIVKIFACGAIFLILHKEYRITYSIYTNKYMYNTLLTINDDAITPLEIIKKTTIFAL